MGNGQCPVCCGNKPGDWAPHPCVPTPAFEGHRKPCTLAMALEDLGEVVSYKRAMEAGYWVETGKNAPPTLFEMLVLSALEKLPSERINLIKEN